jgi:hypothetical protein
MGPAEVLLLLMTVAVPRGGASAAVMHPDTKAKTTVASPCVPAKLTPLHASKPNPAQRVMPGLY